MNKPTNPIIPEDELSPKDAEALEILRRHVTELSNWFPGVRVFVNYPDNGETVYMNGGTGKAEIMQNQVTKWLRKAILKDN